MANGRLIGMPGTASSPEHAFASPLGYNLKSGGGKAELFHRDITLVKALRWLRFADHP